VKVLFRGEGNQGAWENRAKWCSLVRLGGAVNERFNLQRRGWNGNHGEQGQGRIEPGVNHFVRTMRGGKRPLSVDLILRPHGTQWEHRAGKKYRGWGPYRAQSKHNQRGGIKDIYQAHEERDTNQVSRAKERRMANGASTTPEVEPFDDASMGGFGKPQGFR